MKLLLDLGSGNNKYIKNGYRTIGVDYLIRSKADIIANLNSGLPFKDNIFDYIHISHVLEHVIDPISLLYEAYRVGKRFSIVVIKVPHHSNFRAYEIHHKSYWNYFSLDSLCCKPGKSAEQILLFVLKKREITLQVSKNNNILIKVVGKVLQKFINRFPYKYESYLWHFLPAYEITFILSVLK